MSTTAARVTKSAGHGEGPGRTKPVRPGKAAGPGAASDSGTTADVHASVTPDAGAPDAGAPPQSGNPAAEDKPAGGIPGAITGEITCVGPDGNEQFPGVVEVVEALKRIEKEASKRKLGEHDGLACFDYLYLIITRSILNCLQGTDLIRGEPSFHDRPFMAQFDVAFARRFLGGTGDGIPDAKGENWKPECWQVLLGHREDPHLSPLIFAVAGVNAHVNFDLPYAVITACEEMNRELDSGYNHADYQLIDKIFDEHMQQLRRHFESRFEKGFDKALMSKIENMVGDLVVMYARNAAWGKALKLWEVHEDADEMYRLARSRDHWVALANRGLFVLDRIPGMAFKAMDAVPGPTRWLAARSLGRTGAKATGPVAPAPEV